MPAKANNVDVSMRAVRIFLAASALVLGSWLPLGQALSLKRAGATPSRSASAFSFLSIEQVPGPTPAYVNYGKPEFTTFNNATTACQACVEFWPAKEDGERFHGTLYNDVASGGVWARSCRAGTCDFRDPQTDPVGGVIGKGDKRTCITRDPVPWFSDCTPVLLESTHTLLDATRYCSYREQIFIPPPNGTVSRFGGKPEAWARIGGTHEKTLHTIEREGAALFDSMTFCDSNLPMLSGACETVYSALTCVAETASARAGVPKSSVLAEMGSGVQQMLDSFARYCVPLCTNTKESFCKKYPGTDICVSPLDCTGCTAKGGLWCPKLKSCHCPSKNPPCIAKPLTTPMQCLGDDGGPKRGAGHLMDADDGPGDGPADDGDALCKYKEMARMWKGRD